MTIAAGCGLTYIDHFDLEAAANWAQLLSVVIALMPLAAWLRARERPFGTTPAQADRAQRALAATVQQQWREEILLRQLDDPLPLAVKWRLIEIGPRERISDVGWPVYLRSLLRFGRRRFEGRTHEMPAIARSFRDLDHRRMVILGEPGMGKTTFAVLLLRELLANPETKAPVPVLFSLSGWRPSEESLHEWLTRHLAMEYPILRTAEFGTDAPRTLVADRRILPVLDGLDEMPAPLRPAAIEAINAATTRDDSFILTCRTAEYEAILSTSAGIRGGAIVAPAPLRPQDVAAYLTKCLDGRVRHRDAWLNVLQEIVADQPTPLKDALTTPLFIWLLRKIYIDPDSDPSMLSDRKRFPTREAVISHLIDHLTKAITVTANQRRVRVRPEWKPDDAELWLSFLAHHLEGASSRDIAWWQLHRAVRLRPVHRVLVGGTLGLVFGLLTSATAWLTGLLLDVPGLGFLTGFVGGLMVGLAFGLASATTAAPAHASLRLSGRTTSLLRTIGFAMFAWLLVGVAAGTLLTRMSIATEPVGPPVISSMFGLVHGFMVWVATPVADYRTQSPASTLRGDVQLALIRTMVFVLVGGAVAGSLARVMGEAAPIVVLAVTSPLTVILQIGSPPKVASSVYLATVSILAIRGEICLRLMTFLKTAHHLGLLRQAGPVYQFRHAMLQDRLAQTYRPRTSTNGRILSSHTTTN